MDMSEGLRSRKGECNSPSGTLTSWVGERSESVI